jgi:transcriptional regulator with XRE-family HTH domain
MEYDLEMALHRYGLTRRELAKRLGLNPTTVSHWKEDVPQYAVAYLEKIGEIEAFKNRMLIAINSWDVKKPAG